ncbi:elongator subunit iki1 domain-containing protein [Ditylenchus destructor]|uniref:Elongator complex protein 5 n=1 Tax=Ditylenchus destructor TaxID=166010 RepID=A0AAD4MXR6_9BILA|nr:elongator subunit iki1 domain-containing protein [Ditylenchus destructor]
MQNVPLKGAIVIRDRGYELSGLPLWCAIVRKALDLNFDVTVALMLHLQRDLPEEIVSRNNSPKIKQFLDSKMTLAELESTLTSNHLHGTNSKSVLFLDSVDMLKEKFGLAATIQLLHRLSESVSAVVSVTSIGKDSFAGSPEDLNWRKLCSICSATLDLDASEMMEDLICVTRTRKKDGLVSEKIEKCQVSSQDFSLQSSAFDPNATKDPQKQSKPEDQFLENLPFDVGLKLTEKERQAKANVQLPYVKAQDQKGLVGLNITSGKKIKVGGNIIYTPDRDDDLDDSDPDDDLMI